MNDMKKIAYISLAVLACAACQREVDAPVQEAAVPTYRVVISAGLETTKTAYNDEGKFSWEAGDKIGVVVSNGTDVKQVVFTTEDAKPVASFAGDVPEGYTVGNIASYPFEGEVAEGISNDLLYDAAKDAWVLSAGTLPDPENPKSGIPLIGQKDINDFFQFTTATGIVKFTVENVPSAAKLAELKGVDGAKLAGVFAADKGVLTMAQGGETVSVVRNFSAPKGKNTTMDFYFFLPVGTLAEGTSFNFYDSADASEPIKSFPFVKAVEVKANKVINVKAMVLPEEPTRKSDSLALVAIYNASKGAEWAKNKWDLSAAINNWNGVTVTNDRVTALKITTSGTIASEWVLPEEIGDLTELTELRINSNKLSGALPESLFTLSKLQKLYFQTDNLTGEISSKMGQLTELTELYLNGNSNLSGDISWIGNLTKLTAFNIATTQIGGSIPATLANCTALKSFMANNSAISGTLPDIWGAFANTLTTLMLYSNEGLTGPLPASIGSLTKVTGIQLQSCNFTGNIPAEWGNLPANCGTLAVNGNKLQGVVPTAVQNHTKWQATSGWKYETKILPQQPGYGLTTE